MAAEKKTKKGPSPTSGATSKPGLANFDKLIHEQLRLGILSALAAADTLSFTELKDRLDASDGNLSVHARKLEDAGYLSCNKTLRERMPRTEFRLTAKGRRALTKYLAHMEALIRVARGDD